MMAFLHSLLFKDLWLKLFSLALAVLMWFTISSAIQQGTSSAASLGLGSITQRTFSGLPVSVLSSARQVQSSKVQPETVNVIVEGDARVLNSLQRGDIKVVVDLTDIETAQELKKRLEVSKPAGVALVRVEPEQVRVSFATRN